ncbi:unnamed protein product, partial [Symbiodinium microadriaticum]
VPYVGVCHSQKHADLLKEFLVKKVWQSYQNSDSDDYQVALSTLLDELEPDECEDEAEEGQDNQGGGDDTKKKPKKTPKPKKSAGGKGKKHGKDDTEDQKNEPPKKKQATTQSIMEKLAALTSGGQDTETGKDGDKK